MGVIGTPEFNYLDGWVKTFGNIVYFNTKDIHCIQLSDESQPTSPAANPNCLSLSIKAWTFFLYYSVYQAPAQISSSDPVCLINSSASAQSGWQSFPFYSLSNLRIWELSSGRGPIYSSPQSILLSIFTAAMAAILWSNKSYCHWASSFTHSQNGKEKT